MGFSISGSVLRIQDGVEVLGLMGFRLQILRAGSRAEVSGLVTVSGCEVLGSRIVGFQVLLKRDGIMPPSLAATFTYNPKH